jgi:S-adenosylmethionine decarboxylase proenzyme
VDTFGQHLLVEYHGCRGEVLDDLELVESTMRRAAEAAGATVVNSVFHPFEPHGVTGVVVLEESHLSIHTWPESGYAAVDFYTCGDCSPERADPILFDVLGATHREILRVERGRTGPGPSMRISSSTDVLETDTSLGSF